jgi:hypothetical protein
MTVTIGAKSLRGGACTRITAQMYAGVKATTTLVASAAASPLVATAQHARRGKGHLLGLLLLLGLRQRLDEPCPGEMFAWYRPVACSNVCDCEKISA